MESEKTHQLQMEPDRAREKNVDSVAGEHETSLDSANNRDYVVVVGETSVGDTEAFTGSAVSLTTKPPDGGWGWVVVFACMIGHVLMVGMARSFGVIFVVLMEKFDASAAATAWVLSLYNFCRMVTGPLVSRMCLRFGCRRVVLFGSCIMSAGFIASAFASSVVYVCVSFGVVAGFGGGFIFTPMFIMLNDYFDRNRGKAMAFSTLGSGLGTVGMAPLIVFLLHEYTYSGTMLIIGGLVMNNFAVGGVFRPLPSTKTPSIVNHADHSSVNEKEIDMSIREKQGTTEVTSQSELTKNTNPKSRCCSSSSSFQLIKNRTFLLYCIHITSMPFCIQGALVFIPPLCKELGIDSTRAGLLLSLMGACDMVGRFLFGILFDVRRIIPYRRPLHSVLGLGMGLSVMSVALMRNYSVLLAGVVLWGLLESGFHSQRATIQGTFIPKSQMSNVVGYMILCQGVGNLTSATLGGFLADITQTFRVPFLVGGAFMTLTASVFLLDYLYQHRCARNVFTEVSKA